jgi:hypothetical protein
MAACQQSVEVSRNFTKSPVEPPRCRFSQPALLLGELEQHLRKRQQKDCVAL